MDKHCTDHLSSQCKFSIFVKTCYNRHLESKKGSIDACEENSENRCSSPVVTINLHSLGSFTAINKAKMARHNLMFF